MRRLVRVLLVCAALAGLVLSWLIYARLGSGSACEYPADCVEWWLPKSYDEIEFAWLLTVVPTWAAVALAWHRSAVGFELAVAGSAGLAILVSIAITPMALGSRSSGQFEFYADSYLWMRMGLNGMDALAVVVAAGSLLLAWRARRWGSSDAAPVMSGRDALLWWPVGSAVPLVVVTCAIAAEAGTHVGLAERTAGTIAALPLIAVVTLLVWAAHRRSLTGVTAASLLVLATQLILILVSVKYAYNEDWPMLGIDIAVVTTALLLPLVPGWIATPTQRSEQVPLHGTGRVDTSWSA